MASVLLRVAALAVLFPLALSVELPRLLPLSLLLVQMV
jgi:hypothetical protein